MKKKLVSLTILLITMLTMFASVQARNIPADEKVQRDYTCSGAPVDCWVIVVN